MSDESIHFTSLTLPTKGLINPQECPSGILTVRAMKSPDQALLVSAKQSNADIIVEKVIMRCITDGWQGPRDHSLSPMTTLDRFATLLTLRVVTYGPEYQFSAICPYCDAESDYVIDLNKLPVSYADDDFVEPLTTYLPVCKATIEWRLLRGTDEIALRAHKKSRKGSLTVDPSHLFQFARRLVTVNGKASRNVGDSLKFVKDMHAKDELIWQKAINDIKIGVEQELDIECKNFDCGRRHEISMPMSEDFFRPGLAGEPEVSDILTGSNRVSYDGAEDELHGSDQPSGSGEGSSCGEGERGVVGAQGECTGEEHTHGDPDLDAAETQTEDVFVDDGGNIEDN